jgi:hypothetical protein
MYLFYPHGSRNILNLTGVKSFDIHDFGLDSVVFPQVVCVDQEPLNYQLYQHYQPNEVDFYIGYLHKKHSDQYSNLRFALPENIHDQVILLHSEKNSKDLESYTNDGYVGVYYWCHAFIARDWYRFAQHDRRLAADHVPDRDFLIYCRDWSGLREYRIKFQELLYQHDLVKHSQTGIKKINGDGFSINNFEFKNPNFVPESTEFFHSLADNQVAALASADYCSDEFVNSKISVVLETVFDDSKIHLTEKILRPIACGHPFVLASGPGSLEYLRSYGFKTFAPWLNEDYDTETDSVARLQKIIQSMQEFANLPPQQKIQIYQQIKKIADYNKQWFFSNEFMNLVNQELVTNISTALQMVKQTRATMFRSRDVDHSVKHLEQPQRSTVACYLKKLRTINPGA